MKPVGTPVGVKYNQEKEELEDAVARLYPKVKANAFAALELNIVTHIEDITDVIQFYQVPIND